MRSVNGLRTEEEVETMVSEIMVGRFPIEFADAEDDPPAA